jgi:16S rRNA (guanine527-N7)-methyltransferase
VTSHEFQQQLATQAGHANLSISTELADSLEAYFRVLAKWNDKINLTGLNLDGPDPIALDRLLIEPLVAARHVTTRPGRMIDLGSGGGSPAIPIALALAPVQLLMVESRSRKSVFLQEAARSLGMQDARVANSRYQALLADPSIREQFDLLTVRAVRVTSATLDEVQSFVRPHGWVLLFRSDDSYEPVSSSSLRTVGSYPLISSLRSHLDILEKTPDGVPRGTI